MKPVHLTHAQRRGWRKVGDVYLPGNDALPAYSATGADMLIGPILGAGQQEDVVLINGVVGLLAWFPLPLLKPFLYWVSVLSVCRWPLQGPFRLLEMGLRGVVMSSYYGGLDRDASGQSALYQKMDIHIQCNMD